jgi:hypothetical protein
MLSSASGPVPGFNMSGGAVHVPLNVDWWTNMAFGFYPYWPGFQDYLDANGLSTATLNTFAPLPPSAVGLALYFNFIVLNKPWNTAIWSSHLAYILFTP